MTDDEITRVAADSGAARFYPPAQLVREDNYLVGMGFLRRFAMNVRARDIDWGAVDDELRQITGNLAWGNITTNKATDDLRVLLRKVSGQ